MARNVAVNVAEYIQHAHQSKPLGRGYNLQDALSMDPEALLDMHHSSNARIAAEINDLRRRYLSHETEQSLDMQAISDIDDLLELGSAWRNSAVRPNGRVQVSRLQPSESTRLDDEAQAALDLA
jgi:hypothetical protein